MFKKLYNAFIELNRIILYPAWYLSCIIMLVYLKLRYTNQQLSDYEPKALETISHEILFVWLSTLYTMTLVQVYCYDF
jgi:valyl-tRNA synthetase